MSTGADRMRLAAVASRGLSRRVQRIGVFCIDVYEAVLSFIVCAEWRRN